MVACRVALWDRSPTVLIEATRPTLLKFVFTPLPLRGLEIVRTKVPRHNPKKFPRRLDKVVRGKEPAVVAKHIWLVDWLIDRAQAYLNHSLKSACLADILVNKFHCSR